MVVTVMAVASASPSARALGKAHLGLSFSTEDVVVGGQCLQPSEATKEKLVRVGEWTSSIGKFIDPDGRAAETPWDVANVIWDVGKVAYGAATGNPALVVEGQIDFANDLVAVAAPGYPAGGTKLARAGREVAEGVPSSAVSRVKNAATEWWAGVFNKSDVDTEMGEYAVVGGHHVFSKAVLKDAVGYSPKGGFSISQAFMKKMKWDHGEMTKVQRTMLKEMGDAGKTPTLADQTRVAFSSLVAGGASRKEARALVEQALNDLVSRGGSNGPFRNWGD